MEAPWLIARVARSPFAKKKSIATFQMVDPELRLEPVVGLLARSEHDAGVVDQDVDVHILGEDGVGKLFHGT